ncbi:MAG: NAD-dependent malic enzyme [Candidatus Marinimicrobia bacterium]|nr:NAD-dependent malic enzyme [Candidatus Neomarinimicrobiota bacterium]
MLKIENKKIIANLDNLNTPVCNYFDIRKDQKGKEYMISFVRGIAVLRFVLMNKGTAFTINERKKLGLQGLLPSRNCTEDEQIKMIYKRYSQQLNNLAKYQYLRGLQERHEILYYILVARYLEEMLPIIYTPTVGEAVIKFSSLYESPRGLSISLDSLPDIPEMLKNYPLTDVRMIVATDSSAILGIGDQGYGGLAIAIGKLSIYTVGGGISPYHSMPACIDVGTNRQELLDDPAYLGARHPRLIGNDYLEFLDKFVNAVTTKWPDVIIQWEDLSKETAFMVLDRYRDKFPSFNDDIQGTGAVALSGIKTACRIKKEKIINQKFIILGAGAGGIGVAWAIINDLIRNGMTKVEAKSHVLVFDSKGLLLDDCKHSPYKQPYTQPKSIMNKWPNSVSRKDIVEIIKYEQITAILGLSGQAGVFNKQVVEALMKNTCQPIIFPLSNPNSHSEGIPLDILKWSNGKALIATGSPFKPVSVNGIKIQIGQGNNAFIFPGLGLGAILCHAKKISNAMILSAADALADYTKNNFSDKEYLFPPISKLQEASIYVAENVINTANAEGLSRKSYPETINLKELIYKHIWKPTYLPIVTEEQFNQIRKT